MAREVSPSSHKCEGNDSVIPGLKRSFPSTSFVSKSLLRQLGSGVYSKEGELYQIKTSEQLDAEHLSTPCFQKMGDCSSSYSQPPEFNSRFSISRQSSSDRMESRSLIFPSPSSLLSSTSGRSVCHSPEYTARGIPVLNARQLGSSPGCHVIGGKPMVFNLPVSSRMEKLTLVPCIPLQKIALFLIPFYLRK